MRYLSRLVNMHTINLKYYGGVNLVEKWREIKYVAGELMSKYKVPVTKVSYWLGIPTKNLRNTIKEWKQLKQLSFSREGWFHEDNVLNIKWFLKHKSPVNLSQQKEDYIVDLLSLPISTSQISRDAFVKQPLISYLRNGKRDINNLSICTTTRLINYYNQIRNWASSFDILKSVSHSLSYDGSGIYFTNTKQIKNNIKHNKLGFIPKQCALKISSYKNTIWHIYIFTKGNIAKAGVCIEDKYPSRIITFGSPTDEVYRLCKLYAHTKNRNKAMSSALYIRHLLKTKVAKIQKLLKKKKNVKDIAKILKLNINFIKLVKENKLQY